MENRAQLLIGLLVALTSAGCSENQAGERETSSSGECADACPEEMSVGSSSGGSPGTAGGSASGSAGAGGADTDPAGASPSGEAGATGNVGSPSVGGANSKGGEAGAPTSDDAGSPPNVDPEPDDSAGGSPSVNGSGGTGGDVAPAPEVEPDAPPDDSGPSSSRLTPRPIDTTDAALGYWEYLPPGYSSGPVPLLVFTHGAAWQGAGTLETLQELLEVGPPNLISTDAWANERPFLVLAPQNPHSGCFTSEDIDGFYRYALANYDVDPQRIYHTGQSCGAIGAWNYLAEHLDEFVTAAVLISGDGQPAFELAGCDLARISIWGLHNENDASVDAQGTILPINGLLECDPAPDNRLTIYPDASEHDAWTKTYDLSEGNDIYGWLLEHVHP